MRAMFSRQRILPELSAAYLRFSISLHSASSRDILPALTAAVISSPVMTVGDPLDKLETTAEMLPAEADRLGRCYHLW